jgi:hypothetical protein
LLQCLTKRSLLSLPPAANSIGFRFRNENTSPSVAVVMAFTAHAPPFEDQTQQFFGHVKDPGIINISWRGVRTVVLTIATMWHCDRRCNLKRSGGIMQGKRTAIVNWNSHGDDCIVFWYMTPCSLGLRTQHREETFCLQLGRMTYRRRRQQVPLNCWFLSSKLHDVISQRAVVPLI